MKKLAWKVVALGASLMAAILAVGQTNQIETIADIPFAFTVASHTFEPGRYTVTRLSDTLLRISNAHHEGTVVLTSKVERKASENTAKMVFRRYGPSYFLPEVWVAGSETGRKAFLSRPPQQFVQSRIDVEVALLKSDP
jgi:hypothetical protein